MSQVLGDPEDESTRGKEGRVGREVPWPPGGVKVMWGLNSSPRKGKVVARAIAFPAYLKLPFLAPGLPLPQNNPKGKGIPCCPPPYWCLLPTVNGHCVPYARAVRHSSLRWFAGFDFFCVCTRGQDLQYWMVFPSILLEKSSVSHPSAVKESNSIIARCQRWPCNTITSDI